VSRDRFLSAVVAELGRSVGESMASAAVHVQLGKIEVKDGILTEEQAHHVLSELAPGLHVFVGRATTQAALEAVRLALGLTGRG
jgi:hypothetical protein